MFRTETSRSVRRETGSFETTPPKATPIETTPYVEALLEEIRKHVDHDLPNYTDAFRAAFRRNDPVFIRAGYGEFFFHCAANVPGWMQRTLLLNAQGEGEGAVGLARLARGVAFDAAVARQVEEHARDEARHSRMFANIAQLAFPQGLAPERMEAFAAALPDIRPILDAPAEKVCEGHLIDNLVQMNIGEVRTRLHMHLFAPVVFHVAPEGSRDRVRGQLEILAHDEMRHIGYTALLMENWARSGDKNRIEALYLGRLNTFNQLTITHTRHAVERYGQGRFPNLLEL
ncbi:hypothetical protein [Caulobacter sp.]|uniref:hypothetical protein n=1 Tax=Caulobacter sp. TaxID=78 RepID=UPI002B46B20F|nr:hypothetical protein [Caulobacter sp.]HJV43538.1 hypothetical protein [Caulobacter sp.]